MLEGFESAFREEALELLNGLEHSLLELESNPDDGDTISSVFRAMHTIKGSAGMFGFDAISGFAHHVESVLDDVRSGAIRVSRDLIDLTLQSRDHIRSMLDAPDEDASERSAELIGELEALVARARGTESPTFDGEPETEGIGAAEAPDSGAVAAAARAGEPAHEVRRTYTIQFRPHRDFLRGGHRPLLLLAELATMGEMRAIPVTARVPSLDAFDPAVSYVEWDVTLTTTAEHAAIRDVFMFAEDLCDLEIAAVGADGDDDGVEERRLGQILVERGVITAEQVERVATRQRRIGELLAEEGVDQKEIEAALEEQEHARQMRRQTEVDQSAQSVRVRAEKLDDLVDLVGELVTLQARLGQTVDEHAGADLFAIAEGFERLIGSLRDQAMEMRMVPISSTFARFRRLVRDLSRDLKKDVELVTVGGETELDKTVIDRLNDPLIHIVRNSLDHGIEPPDVREAAGKPRRGSVTLLARHTGASVEVRVTDDGKGLDRERVLARAVERGVVAADDILSDEKIFDLVFAPGFSTAETVTAVSGRGVGMDVVRREVEAIGGTVSIESTAGSGTSIILSIPLTLAIIDGLLVRIAEERFVVPLSNVEECLELIDHSVDDGVTTSRGDLLPLIDLRQQFGIDEPRPRIEQAVVVQTGLGRVGFVVDQVIGDHQTVIKNLGRLYRNINAVSGATVLGDGSVALIVDVQRLAAECGHGVRRAG